MVTFLSAYLVGGMEGHYYPALYRPDCIDVAATVKSANENRDIVKGFKAHAEIGGFARWGIESMRRSAEIASRPICRSTSTSASSGRCPTSGANGVDPDTILEQVVPLLKPGDILAHPFTRHPGGFVNREGKVHPIVKEAIARGLKTDVGHGSHFSYRMARIALDAGIVPDTLGADMHGYNTRVPAAAGTPSDASRQGAHVLRPDALLARLGDDLHARARTAARADRADGDYQPRRGCSACRARSALSGPAPPPT